MSLSSVCSASRWLRMMFFVACIRVPKVPRMVMPMVFAKILAGSSSKRVVSWFLAAVSSSAVAASSFVRPAVFAASF